MVFMVFIRLRWKARGEGKEELGVAPTPPLPLLTVCPLTAVVDLVSSYAVQSAHLIMSDP